MATFLERYLQGEYQQVWEELVLAGDAVRYEPLHADALAVVQETMRRSRENILRLIARLSALGYAFGLYPDATPFPGYLAPLVPPAPDLRHRIAALEAQVGTIPLALCGFWEIVGAVNLIGYHPNWPEYSDPLVIEPIEAAEEMVPEGPADAAGSAKPNESFLLLVAPDDYHKDNVSGGMSYHLRIPNSAIDGKLEAEWHATTFVNYLRIAFRTGGFPGFERCREPLPPELRRLSVDLLPI